MALRQALTELARPEMRGGTLRMVLASLLAAASEGIGFALLVPLLSSLDPGAMDGPGIPFANQFGLPALLALFVALIAVRAVAEYWRAISVQDLSRALVDGLRMKAVRSLLGARWRWLAGLQEGEAEGLLASDIDRCAYAVQMLAGLVRLVLALLALMAAAAMISLPAAFVAIAGGVVAYLLFAPVRRKARAIGEDLSTRHEAVHARLSRMTRGLRVIKSFEKEDEEAALLETGFRGLRHTERAYVGSSALAQGVLQIGGATLAAIAIWAAMERLAIPLPAVLALAAIFVRALPLIGQLQASAQGWAYAAPAFENAGKFIAAAEAHREPAVQIDAPRLRSSLSLKGVEVDFPDRDGALEGVDLDIQANTMVALCGVSGSGKSTLADICSGLTEPDAGTIAVDGEVLNASALRSWRSRTAYVQQETVLFGGSVRDNLLFADPSADDERLWNALQEANADFVARLPGGLDCRVGASGRELSGGERQRIALARALLRSPDLIILDEATSALDPESEKAIAQALRAMTSRRTVLAIAHRGLLPEIADHIVRLERGRVALS